MQGCRFVIHFWKQAATDGNLDIGSRIWLWFRAKSTTLLPGKEKNGDLLEALLPKPQEKYEKTSEVFVKTNIPRWCFQIFFIFTPIPGKMIQSDSVFFCPNLRCFHLILMLQNWETDVDRHSWHVVSTLAFLIALTEFGGLVLHWHCARKKRYSRRSELVRVANLALTDLRVSEMVLWLCLGLVLSPSYAFFEMFTSGRPLREIPLMVTYILVLAPAAFPHMATTLLLQEDLEHLAAELTRTVETGTEEVFEEFMVEVRYTKTRWTTFLRFHFLLEGTSVFAFVVAMVFMFLRSIFFGLQYALLASMHSGPIVSVYMLLQILSLARFNEQILRCRATTRSNTMYRLISQFEGDLQFRVLGVTITHNKIRAVMTSVVISACSKSVVALVTWLPWAVQKKQCKREWSYFMINGRYPADKWL